LLLEEVEDEGTRRYVQKLKGQTDRANTIVKNLLSFARRHEPRKSYISINECLTRTVELRAYELNLDNIQVILRLDDNLPKTMADFNQLQQVFLNIVTNAHQVMMEAHGRGMLVIQTKRLGDMMRIRFADDGPGIPADKLDRIFEPFFTTKDVGKGTGLGLSICYGIVQEHGGRIWAESEEGKGALFVVELPIIIGEDGYAEANRGVGR
jgi:two-component system NtrC family sensor kinase